MPKAYSRGHKFIRICQLTLQHGNALNAEPSFALHSVAPVFGAVMDQVNFRTVHVLAAETMTGMN